MVQVFVMIKIFKYDKLMEFWLWWKKISQCDFPSKKRKKAEDRRWPCFSEVDRGIRANNQIKTTNTSWAWHSVEDKQIIQITGIIKHYLSEIKMWSLL